MANFSACKPIFRAFSSNAITETTYKTNAHAIGKMVKVDVAPQFKEGTLYGDDAIAENKKVFNYADITLETTDFPATALADVFGITSTGTTNLKYAYKDSTESNYGKFGYVFGKVVDSVNIYVVDVYTRVKFDLPTETFTTAGENIEFGTSSITGRAYVDSSGEWRNRTEYDTLAAAITALETAIGGTLISAGAGGEVIPDGDEDPEGSPEET